MVKLGTTISDHSNQKQYRFTFDSAYLTLLWSRIKNVCGLNFLHLLPHDVTLCGELIEIAVLVFIKVDSRSGYFNRGFMLYCSYQEWIRRVDSLLFPMNLLYWWHCGKRSGPKRALLQQYLLLREWSV